MVCFLSLGILYALFCVQLVSPLALNNQLHNFEGRIRRSEEATCPNAEDFAPCTCEFSNLYHDISADCSAVQDISELVQAFQIDFPTSEFAFFVLNQNKHITTLPSGVFDKVTFQIMDMQHTNLETIEEGALSTQTMVRTINLEHSHITEFPWTDLEKMSRLDILWLDSNRYVSLPSFDSADGIKSTSLTKLAFGSHQLTELPTFEEGSLPTVYELEFWNSPIGAMPEGHFSKLEGLQWLTLVKLGLTELTANTLVFSETASVKQIYLRNNNITNIEQGAIQFSSGMMVDLHNNALTSLEEDVWRPLLDQGGNMDVGVNPLPCDCSLAWVIRDFQNNVSGNCPDGTKYSDLDPSMFDDC